MFPETQTLYNWILTATLRGRQGRYYPPQWTYEELKLEKKPLSKLKQQNEKEPTKLCLLVFPLPSSVRAPWVVTYRESTQICFTKEEVNWFVELGSARDRKLQAWLNLGGPMLQSSFSFSH